MRLLAAAAGLAAALVLAGCGADGSVSTAECSAAGLQTPLGDDPTLTAAAEDTRQAIAAAAVACDYEALEAIALGHDRPFTFAYGGIAQELTPAEYWRSLEDAGHPFLALLVRTLELPATSSADVETDAVSDTITFSWPSAGSWDAIAGVYGDETAACWREHRGFEGYRTTIFETGEWWFTVSTETDTGPWEDAPDPPAGCLRLPAADPRTAPPPSSP